MIDYQKLKDKRYTPQKLYNRLIKIEQILPDLHLILEKIIRKADFEDDLITIHEDLFIAYFKSKYVIDYMHNLIRIK
jgi:hypothetical protein